MKNTLAIFVSGVCIGVMLGLSRSETLSSVLVPIISVLMSLVSIVAGVKLLEKDIEAKKIPIVKISAVPVMFLLIGIIAGIFPGNLLRNYNVLSPNSSPLKTATETDNKDENEVIDTDTAILTGLYSYGGEICENIGVCELTALELLCELQSIENPEIEKMLFTYQDNLGVIVFEVKKICQCE
ncbi:MAG: hypothetical protein GYB31_13030 [Bacteroidetes bacterium]|nr:hypothetical protein [Bacteroidota bacterium]